MCQSAIAIEHLFASKHSLVKPLVQGLKGNGRDDAADVTRTRASIMSRAFIKEDQTQIDLPDRPISKHRNFVTPEGLVAIEAEIGRSKAAHQAALDEEDVAAAAAALRELRYWGARRASAEVVRPTTNTQMVSFGMKVTIRRGDGREQTFRIVGEDEADPSRGTVSYVSPLARAVLSGKPGDTVKIGQSEATILTVQM